MFTLSSLQLSVKCCCRPFQIKGPVCQEEVTSVTKGRGLRHSWQMSPTTYESLGHFPWDTISTAIARSGLGCEWPSL